MDITLLIAVGTLAMIALAGGIVFFVIMYQRRVIQSQIDIERVNRNRQQELLHASIQSEEEERTRIASELHDDVAPTLASIKLYLNSAMLLASGERELLLRSKILLDESLKKIRDIAHKLQPSTLFYLGLQVSLQGLAEVINNSGSIKASHKENGKIPRMEQNKELSIYRIVQELVNNTIKHAHPTEIRLESGIKDNAVCVVMAHNGLGITQSLYEELIYRKGAMGLKNILSRMSSLHGVINFEQKKVDLFTVSLKVPVTNAVT